VVYDAEVKKKTTSKTLYEDHYFPHHYDMMDAKNFKNPVGNFVVPVPFGALNNYFNANRDVELTPYLLSDDFKEVYENLCALFNAEVSAKTILPSDSESSASGDVKEKMVDEDEEEDEDEDAEKVEQKKPSLRYLKANSKPILLQGSHGEGKSTLLRILGSMVFKEGWRLLFVPLEGLMTTARSGMGDFETSVMSDICELYFCVNAHLFEEEDGENEFVELRKNVSAEVRNTARNQNCANQIYQSTSGETNILTSKPKQESCS